MFSYEERNKAVNLTNTIRFKLYRCYIICELDYPARESLRNWNNEYYKEYNNLHTSDNRKKCPLENQVKENWIIC